METKFLAAKCLRNCTCCTEVVPEVRALKAMSAWADSLKEDGARGALFMVRMSVCDCATSLGLRLDGVGCGVHYPRLWPLYLNKALCPEPLPP